MRVISRKKLKAFAAGRKHDAAIAERDLSAWHKIAKKSRWANFGSLRQTFGSADQVGNCVVFDVGNNRFRVICRVYYNTGHMLVLKVMDHAEYDKKRWISGCGCDKPPPRSKK